MKAILLPGFNGRASQPLLVKTERALLPLGLSVSRHALRPGKPSEGLKREMAELRSFIEMTPVVLVGRSFGGRVCARHAASQGAEVAALVLFGFPIRPPGKQRPDDEAALLALKCPTLIVQGDGDELGPLRVLRPLVKKNAALSLHVVKGAGHSYGRHEQAAIEAAAEWLSLVVQNMNA